MEKSAKKNSVKAAYEKPHLNVIELAAEEVLATGCKMPGGPTNVGRASCGIGNRCSTRVPDFSFMRFIDVWQNGIVLALPESTFR